MAVITCAPTASVLVVIAAVPPDSATGLPRLAPLFMNCTVPVGVPVPPTGATAAVNVTGTPGSTELALTVRVVVVGVSTTGVMYVVGEVNRMVPGKSPRLVGFSAVRQIAVRT